MNTIRSQMMLLFTLVLGLGVVALIVSFSVMIGVSDHRHLEKELDRIQEQTLRHLMHEDELLEKEATLFAGSPILSVVLKNGDLATIKDSLSTFQENLELDEIDVINEEGEWVTGTTEILSKIDPERFDALYEETLKGVSAKGYLVGDEGFELFSMAVIGNAEADEIWGILVLRKRIDDKYLRGLSYFLGVEIGVLNSGRIISSSLPKAQLSQILSQSPSNLQSTWSSFLTRAFEEKPVLRHSFMLHDWSGNRVADLEIVGSLEHTREILWRFYKIILYLGVGIFVLGFLCCFVFASRITRSLSELSEASEAVESGDYSKEITLGGTGEIGELSKRFASMLKEIKQSQITLRELNLNLEKRVEERTMAVKNLLNNAGQGFLSFDEHIRVQPEFSLECVQIFRAKIQPGVKVGELFFEQEEVEEFDSWMEQAFGEIVAFDLVARLAPSIMKKNGRFYELEYKQIPFENQFHVMCVITDVSDQRELEAQIEENKNKAKMTLRVLSSPQLFIDFRLQMKQLFSNSGSLLENLSTLKAAVHTLKGNAATFCLSEIHASLHQLDLYLHSYPDSPSNHQKTALIHEIEQVQGGYEENMLTLRALLKDHVDWDEANVRVPRRIVASAMNIMSWRDIPEIKELCAYTYPSLRSMFEHIQGLLDDLVSGTEKSLKPVQIVGGEFPINPEAYAGLISSLVHVFRNIVDHGIESTLERTAFGKEVSAEVSVFLDRGSENIGITIRDDGRGIDQERIRDRLVEKGLRTQDEADKMSTAEILDSLFLQGMSSVAEVSEVSGLGIGMSAVKMSVEKMGGEGSIRSRVGKGTRLQIEVPYIC